jgi:UDP-N-acetylglucosamine 2-epimerase (non-hydrolysing)
MKKILVIFGTRPEAIKMAPVVKVLKKESSVFNSKGCGTATHWVLLDSGL